LKRVAWIVVLPTLLSACVLFSPSPYIYPDCDPSLHPYLLEETDFPPNWVRGKLFYDDEDNFRADNSCYAPYYVVNGYVYQQIFQYADEEDAIDAYARIVDVHAWKNPSDLVPSYDGVALEHYLACSSPRYGQPFMCTFIACYGNDVVIFNTHMNEDFMTVEKLEQVLVRIDERMSQR